MQPLSLNVVRGQLRIGCNGSNHRVIEFDKEYRCARNDPPEGTSWVDSILKREYVNHPVLGSSVLFIGFRWRDSLWRLGTAFVSFHS
ncbi:MAG: hypothetical protein AMJ88_17220 [Anaerolineae bacterium SM23_ 63]|nr:MAG: hypothetical protein AMJ88_17220 [Anaerolineae bacterium SM23_ 63]